MSNMDSKGKLAHERKQMTDSGVQESSNNRKVVNLDEGKVSNTDMAVMTIIAAIAIICAAVYIMTAIMNPAKPSAKSGEDGITKAQVTEFVQLPEGVAGYVNGVEIPESKIDEYVETFRAGSGLQDDEAWAKYVVDTFGDTEGVRNYMLEHYINQEIVKQAANALGIELTDEDRQARLEKDMADKNIADEETFWNWIAASGSSKEDYYSLIDNDIYQEKIIELVLPEDSYKDSLDEQTLAYIKQSFPAYATIESLDEVSDNIVDSSREYVIYYLKLKAYNKIIDDFMEVSDIEVGKPEEVFKYQADTGKYQMERFVDQFKRAFDQAKEAPATDGDSGVQSITG